MFYNNTYQWVTMAFSGSEAWKGQCENRLLTSSVGMHVDVLLTQEKKTDVDARPIEIVSAITFPGNAVLRMPAPPRNCPHPQRAIVVELLGATGPFWQHALPTSDSMMDFQGRRFTIKATPVGNDVRVEVIPSAGALTSRQN